MVVKELDIISGLKEKHRQVIDLYMDGTVTHKYKAYKQVYPNCGDSQAKQGYSKLIKRPEVAAYVRLKKIKNATVLKPAKQIRMLKDIQSLDISQYIDIETGDAIRRVPNKYRKFIKGITKTNDGAKIEWMDKDKVLNHALKIAGLLDENNEIHYTPDVKRSTKWNAWNELLMVARKKGDAKGVKDAFRELDKLEKTPELTIEEKDELDADGQNLLLAYREAILNQNANGAKSFNDLLLQHKLDNNKNTAYSFNWDNNQLYNMVYRENISWRNGNFIYIGGRNTGKTEDAIVNMTKKCHTLSGRIIALTRATTTLANKGLYETVRNTIKRMGLEDEFIFRSSPKWIVSKKTGSKFITKGFLETSAKGEPVTDILCDEFDEVPSFEVWNTFLMTARGGDEKKPVQWVACMNPLTKLSWQVQTYFDNPEEYEKEDGSHVMMGSKVENLHIIHTTYKDNQFIDLESKERLKNLHLLAPDLVPSQVYGLLESDRKGGEIVNTWSDRRNLAKETTWGGQSELVLNCDWNDRQHSIVVSDLKKSEDSIFYDIIAYFRLYGLDIQDYPKVIHTYLDYIGYLDGTPNGKDWGNFMHEFSKFRKGKEDPRLWFKHIDKLKLKNEKGRGVRIRLVGDVTGKTVTKGSSYLATLIKSFKALGYTVIDHIRFNRKGKPRKVNSRNDQAFPFLCTVVKGELRVRQGTKDTVNEKGENVTVPNILDVHFRVNRACSEVVEDISMTQKKANSWDAKERYRVIDGVKYNIAGHITDCIKYGVEEAFTPEFLARFGK